VQAVFVQKTVTFTKRDERNLPQHFDASESLPSTVHTCRVSYCK